MNIALKNSLKKSSLTVATFTLFIIVNVNVVSANRLKNYENHIQLGSSKSIDGSTKIGYQELDTRVDDDSQIKKILYKLKMNRLLSRLANGVLTVLNGVMILQITH